MGYGFYGIDISYIIFVIPALILSMYAQASVNSTFKKYSQYGNRRGITGADVARRILDMNGLTHIKIERIAGNLTDHYDPNDKVIRLSDSVYANTSVAALGVAAHEVGHAVQHSTSYAPLKIRNGIFPVVKFASYAAWPLAILGILMSFPGLANFGILLFGLTVAFQVVTLPVEFNASQRALATLRDNQILVDDELKCASKVLKAAALTYVAAAAVAIGNLLRLVFLASRRRD